MTSSINEEAIINMVKNKRFLWDIKDPEYKNISLKTEEFENIGRNFNLTGEEIRRKWRSLRSGFRRELLARSNKNKTKPKTKQWKHFNKLLFLRDSEQQAILSDNEYDDNQQNNSMCVNQSDNVSADDFSELMHLNDPNLTLEPLSDELKLNLIPNDKPDKCQEVNDNTQLKLLQPNIQHNQIIHPPQQILYLKTTNGVSELPLIYLKTKSDQITTNQLTNQMTNQLTNQEQHNHTDQQTTKVITTSTPINHRTTNELNLNTNSYKTNSNVQTPKTKRRKDDSDEELDANDYFGRMVASLIKEFDQEERKSIRLAILQLITNWSQKKNNLDNSNK